MDKSDPLRNLNKVSHKISKPNRNKSPPPLDPSPDQHQQHQQHQQQQQQQHLQHQPPVYNINKNDFREVVQKLTGSASHSPKPSSSRLHRIRPPPLAPQNLVYRPQPPMSPLPPFPSVHGAAESPISAYLRFFQSSTTGTVGMPPSPLAFGCFSPSGGFAPTFPVSPVPSPGRTDSSIQKSV